MSRRCWWTSEVIIWLGVCKKAIVVNKDSRSISMFALTGGDVWFDSQHCWAMRRTTLLPPPPTTRGEFKYDAPRAATYWTQRRMKDKKSNPPTRSVSAHSRSHVLPLSADNKERNRGWNVYLTLVTGRRACHSLKEGHIHPVSVLSWRWRM